MQLQLTAVFEKVREGYIAFVEELPGANTQGDTLEQARSISSTQFVWSLRVIGRWPRNRSVVGTSFASRSACLLEAPRPRSAPGSTGANCFARARIIPST